MNILTDADDGVGANVWKLSTSCTRLQPLTTSLSFVFTIRPSSSVVSENTRFAPTGFRPRVGVAAFAISSTIAIVISGSMEEVVAHENGFARAIFVLSDGIESIVGSSLSCEESGMDFQYDSYLSVSCRFGILAYYWVPSSTWLAFLMVHCELSRTSSSSWLASTLCLGD